MIFGVPIILAIIAFVFVIFIHELGHYFVGRLCGIGASSFSIGFGPKLVSVVDRNRTEWMLCLIPLGGFVKFRSDNDIVVLQNQLDDTSKVRNSYFTTQSSFESSSLLKRSITVLAGPFANFLLAVVIFAYVAFVSGTMSNEPIVGNVADLPSNTESLVEGDQILSVQDQKIERFDQVFEIAANADPSINVKFEVLRQGRVLVIDVPYLFQPVVFNIEMLSPAMKAGIKVGDVFVQANNKKVSSFDDIKRAINDSNGLPVSVVLWRNGTLIESNITPEMRPTETQNGNIVEQMRIGVRGGPLFSPVMKTPNIFEAGSIGVQMTFYVVRMSLVGLVRMIDMTISPKHLSGPVGIAKALSYSAVEGAISFLSLLAAISAGIALINLFPIPILDGGYLMVFLYELVFKAPPPSYIIKFFMMIGFFILFGLMVFATFNDIVR